MREEIPFGMEATQSRAEMFGLADATVEPAGLSSGVADAIAECVVRYQEAIQELAASA